MGKTNFQVGRIFVAPLLCGGYGFGYITYFSRSLMTLSNIFDFIGDEPTPPHDITEKPIIIHDLIVGPEFLLTHEHNAGEQWKFTKMFVEGSVAPKNRYYIMGGPPRAYRRIDILEEEPDMPLSPDEAMKYPDPGAPFPPVPTAQVEVELKRLAISPKDLVKSWRERQKSQI